ncbi:MAG TPA: deoxyribonuclease IV [Gemmatimonadaceae bacterium]|nr:deoxyribonuclease IV [Gemmatimonadaceae bacterium]
MPNGAARGAGRRYIVGAHASDAGGIHTAVLRAAAGGMDALQLFTAIPTYYGDKSSIRAERVERFRTALASTRIDPGNIVVHAAYVLNTATADEQKWGRSAAGLAKELERSSALGVGAVCFHPGAALGGDPEAAMARVARAMSQALEKVSGSTRLLVENTAGAGLTVGRTAHEVGSILADIPAVLRKRAGYGLDTCHLFAAGHDIVSSADALRATLDAFEDACGEPPSFFHLNDSEGAQGSNRDRHALLGQGKIGIEPFRWLLEDRRARGVPLILETPHREGSDADDNLAPDPNDVEMLQLLRGMMLSNA